MKRRGKLDLIPLFGFYFLWLLVKRLIQKKFQDSDQGDFAVAGVFLSPPFSLSRHISSGRIFFFLFLISFFSKARMMKHSKLLERMSTCV